MIQSFKTSQTVCLLESVKTCELMHTMYIYIKKINISEIFYIYKGCSKLNIYEELFTKNHRQQQLSITSFSNFKFAAFDINLKYSIQRRGSSLCKKHLVSI